MASRGLVTVQFLPEYTPNQRRNKETIKQIRSHLASNLRRKKLEALHNPNLNQTQQEPVSSFARSFCACVLVQTTQQVEGEAANKSRAVQKQRAIADSYKICQRCHKVRFLDLNWNSQLKAARQRVPSVSPFLESDFDPFESLPELSGYKQSPQAKRLMNEFKAHMITFWPYETLRITILPAAANDPALFMGLLYSSCCHLEAVRGGSETALSIAIKTEAVRQINLRLSDPQKRDTSVTVASIAYMSSGVFVNGAQNVMSETNAHEQGMELIFNQGLGGTISEDDAVGQSLIKCLVIHKMSRAATLLQPMPPQFIAAFCNFRIYSPSEFLPESPVFCPRDDFYTLEKLPKCSLYTLQIVRKLKSLIDWLLVEDVNDSNFSFEAFRDEILSLPSATSKTSPEKIRGDYIFESVLLTARILLYCVANSTPFYNAPCSMTHPLQQALQKTDIGSCWGTMNGLFFWVALVGAAAAVGKREHKFMGSVICRADHDIVYGNGVFEGATGSAWRFWRTHEVLSIKERG